MAEKLKKITLDGTELEICDDTARSVSTVNGNDITRLSDEINSITDRVDSIATKKGVNITYDDSSSALVITHN